MAVAGSGLDHRHGAVLHYGTNQSGSASWNQYIQPGVHPHKFSRGFPIRTFNQLNGLGRKACRQKACLNPLYDGFIGFQSIAAAFYDYGVPCLKAKAEGVRRHIGTRLVDDAHNAQGNPLLTDQKTVGPRFHGSHLTDGVLKSGHL